MMKFALCHPEKFTHPHIAFILGFIQVSMMWVTETINIMKATQRKTAQELITSYIGFKSIVDIPSIYLGSINNMAIKGKIGAVTATKPRKQENRSDQEKMIGHSFFNAVYVIYRWFFNTFYFYFFPFSVISVPLATVLFVKETM